MTFSSERRRFIHWDILPPSVQKALSTLKHKYRKSSQNNLTVLSSYSFIFPRINIFSKHIITKTYLDFSDQIKQDDDLIEAFEEILEMLIGMGYEEAATILDEFRVH